jgi:hypothetical protein
VPEVEGEIRKLVHRDAALRAQSDAREFGADNLQLKHTARK